MAGKISSREFFEALLAGSADLEDQFEQTSGTIGQAIQAIRDEFTVFVGRLSGDSVSILAQSLNFLADNISTVARVVGAAGLTAAVFLAVGAVTALTAAIAANPIGAIAVGVTTAISLLVTFSDQILVTGDGVTNLADLARAAFEFIVENGQIAIAFFRDTFGGALESLSPLFDDVFGGFEFTLRGFLTFAAQGIDLYIGAWLAAFNAITALFSNFGPLVIDLGTQAINGLIGVVESGIDGILALLRTIANVVQNVAAAFSLSFDNLAEAANQALAGNVKEAARLADQAQFLFRTRLESAFRDLPGQIGRNFEEAADTDLLPRLTNVAEGAGQQTGEAIVEGIVDGFEFSAVEDAVNGLFDRAEEIGRERIARQQEQAVGAGGVAPTTTGEEPGTDPFSVSAGFQRGLANISRDIQDFASLTESTLVNAFNSAEDALVEFVQTGQFNFSGFVDSILADLTRLLARQALVGLLTSIAGAGTGGLSTLASGFLNAGTQSFGGARQFGGDVQAGRQFLIGERGPELFTPSGAGTITPSAQPAPPPEVNVNITNVTDPDEVAGALATPDGERAILNVIRRNRAALQQVNS